MHQAKLLCIGSDSDLLETRLQLLSLHYSARGLATRGSLQSLGHEKFDLVVLCHSLTPDERRSMASLSRERWPQVKILELAVQDADNQPKVGDDRIIALDGPEVLLRAVANLLRQPDEGATRLEGRE